MSKPKRINFEIIDTQTEDGTVTEPYHIMGELRREFHPDISGARIALAWRKALSPDPDGHLVLGKCQRTTDLQREVAPWDFIILLNQEVWEHPAFGLDKKRALIDHELCHAEVALDRVGGPKVDERGRQVWRTRKHDIEEFSAIVQRHGCYKHELEQFAEGLLAWRAQEEKDVHSVATSGV